MHRTALALLAALMATAAAAQQYGYNARPRSTFASTHSVYYGVRLGLAVASVHSDEETLDGGTGMAGLNVGGVIGFQLSHAAPVFLETGLYYTEKGGKGYHQGEKFTYDLNYLAVPIIAKYKFEVADEVSVVPFLGGYLALGVGGKIKEYGKAGKDQDAYSSFSTGHFKRFDGGLRIGCGVEYQMVYADIAYDFGLANISNKADRDFKSSRTGCFYVNVGVNF